MVFPVPCSLDSCCWKPADRKLKLKEYRPKVAGI